MPAATLDNEAQQMHAGRLREGVSWPRALFRPTGAGLVNWTRSFRRSLGHVREAQSHPNKNAGNMVGCVSSGYFAILSARRTTIVNCACSDQQSACGARHSAKRDSSGAQCGSALPMARDPSPPAVNHHDELGYYNSEDQPTIHRACPLPACKPRQELDNNQTSIQLEYRISQGESAPSRYSAGKRHVPNMGAINVPLTSTH